MFIFSYLLPCRSYHLLALTSVISFYGTCPSCFYLFLSILSFSPICLFPSLLYTISLAISLFHPSSSYTILYMPSVSFIYLILSISSPSLSFPSFLLSLTPSLFPYIFFCLFPCLIPSLFSFMLSSLLFFIPS